MSMWAIPFALLLLLYARTKSRANYNPGLNGIPKHAKLIRMSNYLWHVLLKIKLGLLSPLVLHGTPFNMNRNNCFKYFKCMFCPHVWTLFHMCLLPRLWWREAPAVEWALLWRSPQLSRASYECPKVPSGIRVPHPPTKAKSPSVMAGAAMKRSPRKAVCAKTLKAAERTF